MSPRAWRAVVVCAAMELSIVAAVVAWWRWW